MNNDLNMTKEQLAKAKFHHAYMRTQESFMRSERKELLFSKQEFQVLNELARLNDKQLSIYLRDQIYMGLTNVYIPNDEAIYRLTILIKRLSNSHNQLIKHIHIGGITREKINDLNMKVEQIQTEVQTYINQPINLKNLVARTVIINPAFKEELRQLLADNQS